MILPEELEGIAFFQNLDEPHRARLALLAQLREYPEGAILFREGEPSPSIFFVLRGKITLEVAEAADEEAVEVSTAGPGELLGWSPVLGRSAMSATARALTRCRLAALDARKILDLCESDPCFGVAFLREAALVLSERLLATRRSLALARMVASRSPL
jgi:CRP-like cAMP-binding protein